MSALPGDTIAAISTPPGPGGIALVRLSGPRALEIADAVFRGARPLVEVPTHTVHHGRVFDADGAEADEVLATVLRAPSTYTTEDMVEFGCHGGTMASRRVLDACLAAGARLARGGEFTERAFLGGRLDLVQAEAVADVIAARTPVGLALALGQLEGGLSGRLAELRNALIDYRAETEALIDFSDDDIEPATTDAIAALGERALGVAEELLATAAYGVTVREGVSLAIVGRPNVGKSSLMNALLGRERAIVTDEPGTTRDAIEETIPVDGVPVRVIDTAGWREARGLAEAEGVRRARAAADGADIAMLVLDATEPWTAADREIADALASVGARTIETTDASRGCPLVVLNKCDLAPAARRRAPGADATSTSQAGGQTPPASDVVVSALTGEGLDELRAALASRVVPEHPGAMATESGIVTNARHADALRRVRDATRTSIERLRAGVSADLVAQEIADAADALGAVTGETTPDDVLRAVFERFCVGK